MSDPAKILLIDDQPETLSLLSRMLLRHLPDLRVLTARSGPEGLAVAAQEQPDVILLDAKMPQMDGFETCRRLKQGPRTSIIPVLMVSGVLTETRDRVAGMEVGAEGYLCKPFEPEELVAQVGALLRVKRAEDALRLREQRLELQLESRTRTLQESELRFRTLFENSPDAIFVEAEDGRILDVNEAAGALHGLSREQLVGTSAFDLIPPAEREQARREFGRWFDGSLRQMESTSQGPGGRIVPVEIRASRIRYAGVAAVLLHVRDITARRAAEQALRDSEARFRGMLEDLTDLVCRRQPDGRLIFVNPAFAQFVGREAARLAGTDSLLLLPEGERARVAGHLQALTPGQPVRRIEHLMRAGDGRLHWVQWIDRGVFDAGGRLFEIQSAGRDVTEQKLAQEKQTTTTLWLRAVLDMADELIACPDADTLYRRSVELARARLGLERCGIMIEEAGQARGTYGTNLRGETTDERSHQLPLDARWDHFFTTRVADGERWVEERTRYAEWDGQTMRRLEREGAVACTPIRTARRRIGVFFNDQARSGAPLDPTKQEVVAVLCSLIGHIAERKAIEGERAQLNVAVEQSAECVMVLGPDRRVRYVNPAFTRIFGYPREAILGQSPRLLRSPNHHDDAFFDAIWNQVLGGEPWSGRVTERRSSGQDVVTDQTLSPVRGPDGRVIEVLSLIQDVTHGVQLENELRQAQKMETVGRLAGGIAHDFNNLLTGILGFSRLIDAELGPAHPLHADVQEIINAGERAARLTNQLLAFSRKSLAPLHPLDLGAALLGLDQLLRRTLGPDVELVTAVDEGLAAIEADESHIEQIVMNLAINARDAMPRGGTLTISAAPLAADQNWCDQRVGVTPGPFVQLTIRDTGIGMTPEILAHVFEPFFTTKEKGKGSGIGLSTVYAIVKRLRGYIELTSIPSQGTEFRIFFPCSAVPAPALPDPGPAAQPPRGTETLLLVEDEATVRHLATRHLESLGYRVLVAQNGQDALHLAEQQLDRVDGVLTDVVMPALSGPEMVAELRRRRPDLPVVYMSGFTEEIPGSTDGAPAADPLLLKPFKREALARAIRQALDARRPGPAAG